MALAVLDFFSLCIQVCTGFNLVISTPIYVSVITFLLASRHRHPFNSSFYSLFIALGFVNICKYLLYVLKKCSYWGWVPPMFYPLDRPNRAANCLYFLLWALAIAQFQLNILLSLNRFCSICYPCLYGHRWNFAFTRQLLLLVCTVSACSSLPILWQPVCFRSTQIDVDGRQLIKLTGPVFVNSAVLVVYYTATKMFAFVHLGFSCVAYPMMFHRIRQQQILKDRTQSLEVRMLYALVLLLIANVLYASYITTWELLSRSHPHLAPVAEWSLYVIIDFYDMNTAYGLLITSRIVRYAALPRFLLCASKSKPNWRERRSAEAILHSQYECAAV